MKKLLNYSDIIKKREKNFFLTILFYQLYSFMVKNIIIIET